MKNKEVIYKIEKYLKNTGEAFFLLGLTGLLISLSLEKYKEITIMSTLIFFIGIIGVIISNLIHARKYGITIIDEMDFDINEKQNAYWISFIFEGIILIGALVAVIVVLGVIFNNFSYSLKLYLFILFILSTKLALKTYSKLDEAKKYGVIQMDVGGDYAPKVNKEEKPNLFKFYESMGIIILIFSILLALLSLVAIIFF